MILFEHLRRAALGTAAAAVMAASIGTAATAPAFAQSAAVRPTTDVALSVGTGRLVNLGSPITDIFVANDAVADVQVRSANQIYIFGKGSGQTTIYATDRNGRVVYSANVRVGTNIDSIDQMLNLAMPQSQIQATPMNGFVLLTGTVAAPADVEDAQRLVQAFVGEGTQVISRLRTATPLQVNLHVKIAEVNRTFVREIGVNLASADLTSGFKFGVGRGRDFYPRHVPGTPLGTGTEGPEGVTTVTPNSRGTSLFGAGRLLGLDLLGALDLGEQTGLVSTLAEPNLTALSGETASFLAGGEFPIPTAQGISGTSIEFKEYGVGLAFTPTVLEGGRISMRVRPEVSELSEEGSIQLQGFRVPSLTTRRAETTVELGSGQSFMIAGLLRNSSGNSVDRAPFLGSLPIIGALFRSTGFRRNETELVIIVTPYLVRPVNPSQIALPTDGFRFPDEGKRLLLDQQEAGQSGAQRPGPSMAPAQIVTPSIGTIGQVQQPAPANPAPAPARQAQAATLPQQTSAKPGFSF
jgi:pilus assembly protein CpaC